MGALGPAFGFGQAGPAAQSSLGWGAVGTGVGALGDVLSGLGKSQQATYMSQVAANNAAIQMRNAGVALQAGQYEEASSKLRTGLMIGAQRAAQGANGIDVNVGSPVAVRATTAEVGSMDAAMIHYNAQRAALGYETEAVNQTAQSELDKMAAKGSLTSGLFSAGATLLSGASSLSGKAAGYKLSFGGA